MDPLHELILQNQITIMEALSLLVRDWPHVSEELTERVADTEAFINTVDAE